MHKCSPCIFHIVAHHNKISIFNLANKMVAKKMVQREDIWEWSLPFWKTCDAINFYHYIGVFTLSYLHYWPKKNTKFSHKYYLSPSIFCELLKKHTNNKCGAKLKLLLFLILKKFFCAIPLLFIQFFFLKIFFKKKKTIGAILCGWSS